MTNNTALLGLWKMLYLPIFIPTTDSTIGCVMSDTSCKLVWYQTADAGPYTQLML